MRSAPFLACALAFCARPPRRTASALRARARWRSPRSSANNRPRSIRNRSRRSPTCSTASSISPSSAPIAVAAASVACRQSDVDISHHDCTLKFGAAARVLTGRAAHELFATLAENGVPGDGAAGSIYEAVSHLACAIKPAEVKQKAGGGATCAWGPGP